jgi:hypothetical protein
VELVQELMLRYGLLEQPVDLDELLVG